jgi:glycosyltransferase involved in cell wall biosynthesis
VTDVSVVISAYDERRWKTLQAAVASLDEQTVRPREVILVVDHNEKLFERAASELTGVVVVGNTETRGLRGVRNTGAKRSSASIVAYLDDDAFATPTWLESLLAPYVDPAVAGVGGAARPAWVNGRPGWFPAEFDWVVGCSHLGMPAERAEVRNLFGCNMSFRRELLDAVGYFRLGYSCDETELCIRLRQRWPAKRLVYLPNALVHHIVSEDRQSFRRFLSRCYFEGGSKAVVSRLVGADDALASERHYARKILPAGFGRGLGDAARGDYHGAARAGAIVAGLAATTAGYASGLAFVNRAAHRRGWTGGSLR